MEAVLIAAGLVFVAELGDKSQLMAMAFSTRYRARTVLIGMGTACAIINLASALVGDLLGKYIPQDILQVVAGLVFLLFSALTFWAMIRGDDDEEPTVRAHNTRAVLTVGLAFALAELGDKTMFATMTLATQYPWYWVWIGSTLGMLASLVLAVVAGKQVLRVLPLKAVHIFAAVLFAALGIWMLLA